MMRPPARTKLSDAEWHAVKDEIRAILIELAQSRQTITYSGLCLRLQTVTLHPHSFVFTRILREVCGEELEKGHRMLCALVVAKATGMPGGGYFGAMAQLGADASDLEARWREDLEDVFTYWSQEGKG